MAPKKITVLRTGAANLASVLAAFQRLGCATEITTDAAEVRDGERLVVPGVGAFAPVMRGLADQDLGEAIAARVSAGRVTLGICLGLQILASSSEEGEGSDGLGVLPVVVRRFPDTVVVPQLGWNRVEAAEGCRLVGDGAAYFANSFRIEEAPPGWCVAWSDHGGRFVAALERDGVLGCQFHPELSGDWGAHLLERWLEVEPC